MIAPTVILLRLWYHKIPTYTVVGASLIASTYSNKIFMPQIFNPIANLFATFLVI